jgi:hypothetical protein
MVFPLVFSTRSGPFEVDIKVYKDEAPVWRPKKTLHLDMMKILESTKQSGDVKFQVAREEFPARCHLLDARTPESIAKDYSSDTLIPIQDIKPSTFRSLLHFVYADDFPKFELLENEARDRICVSSLRRKFDKRGLDVDGSREMPIRRLERGENDDGSSNSASK